MIIKLIVTSIKMDKNKQKNENNEKMIILNKNMF